MVILKSYFDGGNQADSREYEVLSLAVTMAPEIYWELFEQDWNDVLGKHRVGCLHTTDAVNRVEMYKGWTEAQRDNFLEDCVEAVARHFIRLATASAPGRFGIYCFVISINLADFVAHYQNNGGTALKNANEGCLRQALHQLLLWSEQQAMCESVDCFFDRGEPFYGYIVNILESKKAVRDARLVLKIKNTIQANSRELPGLQMADLFAWAQSHRNDPWAPKWKVELLALPFQWEWIDKTNLNQVHQANQEAWATWKIPQRARTQ